MDKRKILLDALTTGTATVKFRKLDGSIRQMTCTLCEKILSKKVVKKLNESTAKNKPKDPNVIRVYDLENNGWRTILVDRLLVVNRTSFV